MRKVRRRAPTPRRFPRPTATALRNLSTLLLTTCRLSPNFGATRRETRKIRSAFYRSATPPDARSSPRPTRRSTLRPRPSVALCRNRANRSARTRKSRRRPTSRAPRTRPRNASLFSDDGDRFSLVVVLPNNYASYAKVERDLTPAKLRECRAKAKETLVDFRFPKFTVRRSVDLTATLQKAGVVSAFGLDADLTPIAGDANLRLGQAKQGAFLAVDEAGTVAAAATAVTAAPKTVPQAKFYADRPFFYMIRHNASGAVLFAGRFVSPQQAETAETAEVADEPDSDAKAKHAPPQATPVSGSLR
ncbi:MAG: hypothetical protein IJO40_12850 [Thermoguttaceae bacterium]|nr:hypothetical protein [Thermoguttaceae bacterium]